MNMSYEAITHMLDPFYCTYFCKVTAQSTSPPTHQLLSSKPINQSTTRFVPCLSCPLPPFPPLLKDGRPLSLVAPCHEAHQRRTLAALGSWDAMVADGLPQVRGGSCVARANLAQPWAVVHPWGGALARAWFGSVGRPAGALLSPLPLACDPLLHWKG
jgi:hypothetical protein